MKETRRGLILAATVIALASASLTAQSNIYVSGTNFWDPGELQEYTQSGVLLGGDLVPSPVAGEEEEPRDLTVHNGIIHVVQEGFGYDNAYLSRQSDWSHFTTADWTIGPGNVSHGSVASYENYIFATDFNRNLVRFDTSNGYSVQRFGYEVDDPFRDGIVDITIGLDCYLYALDRDGGGGLPDVEVYNPDTLEHLRTINLDAIIDDEWGVRAMAVDTNGDLFLATWEGDIHHLDPKATTVLNTLEDVAGGSSLLDINLNEDGQIVTGSRLGPVAITNTALVAPTTFPVLDRQTESFFVAWKEGEVCTPPLVHADGFESGDFSGWSSTVP